MTQDEDSQPTRDLSIGNLIITVGPMLLCIVLAIVTFYYKGQMDEANSNLASSYFRNRALEDDVRRLRAMVNTFEHPPLQLEPTLTSLELATLQKQGFEDPYHDIASDLVTNPTLLNAEGIPVQLIDIASEDDTCILSPNRALAYYEGENGLGRLLLSYDIGKNNRITWRILENWAPEG
ncbi:MAG TPA: hypothetical protein PLF13_00900 [candidate division Zixibacteria bacterium]|nr:hypothetical protein [candidate division Zixibacteria bacterium]